MSANPPSTHSSVLCGPTGLGDHPPEMGPPCLQTSRQSKFKLPLQGSASLWCARTGLGPGKPIAFQVTSGTSLACPGLPRNQVNLAFIRENYPEGPGTEGLWSKAGTSQWAASAGVSHSSVSGRLQRDPQTSLGSVPGESGIGVDMPVPCSASHWSSRSQGIISGGTASLLSCHVGQCGDGNRSRLGPDCVGNVGHCWTAPI